jgi:hypothetical protein
LALSIRMSLIRGSDESHVRFLGKYLVECGLSGWPFTGTLPTVAPINMTSHKVNIC